MGSNASREAFIPIIIGLAVLLPRSGIKSRRSPRAKADTDCLGQM